LADHCDLYNAALEERREAWRMRKVSISYGTQSAQLKEIRRCDPQHLRQGRAGLWSGRISSLRS
jgi:putative transposase